MCAFQGHRWAAWNVTVRAPNCDPGFVTLTLVRDEAAPYQPNYVVVCQLAEVLQVDIGAVFSSRLLHLRVDEQKRLKKLRIHDPMLLGKLKALSTIAANTSVVKLATCAAASAALRNYPGLKPVAAAVTELSGQLPPLGATSITVTVQQQQAAAALEARVLASRRRSKSMPAGVRDPTSPSAGTAAAPLPSPQAPPPPPPRTHSASPARARTASTFVTNANAAPTKLARAGQQRTAASPAAAAAVATTTNTADPMQAAVRLCDADGCPRGRFYPKGTVFPTTLPMVTWREDARIGILNSYRARTTMPLAMPLTTELAPFEAWCTNAYNFSEGGALAVRTATYRGIENTVSKLLGFAHSQLGVALSYISLRLFSNQVCGNGACVGG